MRPPDGAATVARSLRRSRRNVLAQSSTSAAVSAISCGEQSSLPNNMPIPSVDAQLDSIDREILAELQSDGRLSNVDLAARVHLSPSACLRRVKQL